MGLEANSGAPLDAEDLSFINAQLGQGAADPAAGNADTQTGTQQPPADAAANTTDPNAVVEPPPAPTDLTKDAPPPADTTGEKKDAATVEEGSEKKDEAADPANKPESEPFNVVRSQRNTFKRQLETLEQSVGTLAPVIKSVGIEPLTQLSVFVTSDKPEGEFGKEVCNALEAIDPMRFEQVGNYLVEHVIKTDPQPVFEDLVEYHKDRVAEMLTGQKGATMAQLKEAWAGRGTARGAQPAPKTGTEYTGLDALLEDEDDPEGTKTATATAATEDDLSKLPAAVRAKLEKADENERRLAALEERLTQGSPEDHAREAQVVAERYITQIFSPLGQMFKDSGLLILDGDDEAEKARKLGAQRRIRDEIWQKVSSDPRAKLVDDYITQYRTDPPAYRITQGQALVEEIAEEVFAYHTGTLHRQRTAPTEKLNPDPPANVPGNNQGRTIPGHTPAADKLEGSSWGDMDSLARETQELLERRS